jgi:dihydroorotate dehydrogenase
MKIVFKIPFVKLLFVQTYRVENSFDFLGIKFPNRVGLAAGLDKNGSFLEELSALGFGFIEIGTITPLAQPGNDMPRLFRLKKDESLINRMGFNNDGVDVVAKRLAKRPKGIIVGGNIGKNKITPNENAVQDYLICFEKLYNLVDYFVVNVSSPNTPNLRELQDKKPLMEILSRLIESRNAFIKKDFPHKPILLKIAPDLSNEQLDDVVLIVKETGIEGIVATNTTISREGLLTDKNIVDSIGAGGLSGKILLDRSTEVVQYIHHKSDRTIPMIGVGGIYNEQGALHKINAGASLVQIYTGFIYEGPLLVKKIAKALRRKI